MPVITPVHAPSRCGILSAPGDDIGGSEQSTLIPLTVTAISPRRHGPRAATRGSSLPAHSDGGWAPKARRRSPAIDQKRVQVMCAIVCMFLEDFAGLRELTKAEVVPCYRTYACFGAAGFPARTWHVIVVPIGLTLRSGQLPPQLHAQVLCYQNWKRESYSQFFFLSWDLTPRYTPKITRDNGMNFSKCLLFLKSALLLKVQ